MIWTVLLGAVLAFLLWESLRPDSSNKFKPGKFYYTKKWLFRILLWLNSHRKKGDKQGESLSRKSRGYGASIRDPALLDICQPLENDPYAIDTVYFNGFDTAGTSLALRVARKHNREGELWLWLDLPGLGFFQHPIMPDAGVCNVEDTGYRVQGVRFQVIEPLRSWRVSYNGLLRRGLCNDVKDKPEDYVYVKMSFKWECFNDPFNFDIDLDKNLLADAIARENWTSEFWSKLRGKHQTHYEQCGQLMGTIEVEGHEPRLVYLTSFRDHTFGVRNWELFHRYAIHFIWIEEVGIMAMVAVLWMPGYIALLKTGYLAFANGETYPVTDIDLDIEFITREQVPPEKYSFTFDAADDTYRVDVIATVTPEAYHYRGRTSRVLERFCTYSVNGRPARGLTEYHYRNPNGTAMTEEPPEAVTLLKEPCDIDEYKGQLTLTFQDMACQSSLLVGGKGSQLAMLTSIQEQVSARYGTEDGIIPEAFLGHLLVAWCIRNEASKAINVIGSIVPPGFCLTLAAFEQHLQENDELGCCLDKIVTTIRNENLEHLQQLCSNAVELLASCKMSQPIESELTSQLQAVFGDVYESIPLAVRSSAAGEDGGEASSAGQMETYLGVRGVCSLLDAVRKCWSSAYSYQAVEYRRQQGQPVRTSVGVVIQEMVPSDVSGVLFTNDPVTGSPNRMVLDASFGLGEAVVSGKANPDTIIIQRHFNNTLKILSKTLGEKGLEIRIADSGGVREIKTEMGSTSVCCLEDQQILRLCHLAVMVEAHFGSARDIEWAIHKHQTYLLQARPITTTDRGTDEDIIHEFDTPLPTGQERITLGNIGEMMPGCVTALTGSVFGRAVDYATSDFGVDFGGSGTVMKHALKSLVSHCGRLFLNITWISQVYGNSLLYKKSSLEMNLLGQLLDDHKLSMIKTYGRENNSFLSRLYAVYIFFSYNDNIACGSALFQKQVLELNIIGKVLKDHTLEMIWSYGKPKKPSIISVFKWFRVGSRKIKIADGWYEKLKTYSVGTDCHTATKLYNRIDQQLPDYYQVWATTLHISARSGVYGGIVMGIVSGGKDEWMTDNYSDVALLLSQCNNVYSAEVPMAMSQIAKTIVEMGKEEEILNMSDSDTVQYLSCEDCPVAIRQKYQEFMIRHGHRCIREAELIEKSWRMEPEKLIKVLKAVLKSKAYEESKQSVPSLDEAVAQLKSPVSWFAKFLLRKWIVKKARAAVGKREFGKSVAVDVCDRFKQAYWRLAELLFLEGRIPENELMFYLTHHEIGQLIKSHSARLVTKAARRRKLLPVQEKMEFPKICVGRPQPILKEEEEETSRTTFTLTGMPVSIGSVKGRARIVKTIDDASQIQRGEILIVRYTDVGWSPYFPLISGLVTEMGGLVSHGAVVAREYGLPCVVNVPSATQRFKSGDCVHLDGTGGSIHKLEDVKS